MYFLSSSLNDNWMLLYFKFEHAPPKHYVDTNVSSPFLKYLMNHKIKLNHKFNNKHKRPRTLN
jgi:hypothetical protein